METREAPRRANDPTAPRHPLLRALAFVAVFVFLFVTCSYILRPIYIGGNLSRINVSGFYAEKRNSLDMVYIGGSNTFTYWAPLDAWQSHGIASYLFAVNAMAGDAIRYYVTETGKTQRPKLFVIDLKQFAADGEGPLGNYNNTTLSFNYSLNRFAMIEALYPAGERLIQHIDLFQFHTRWQEVDREALRYAFNRVRNERKGFWFLTDTDTDTGHFVQDCSAVTARAALSDSARQALTALMEVCGRVSYGAEFLFVVSPHTDLTPEAKARYNTIGDVVTSYGFTFLDLNDKFTEMGLDPSLDFANQRHTNVFGAEKYTAWLADYIDAQYALPDRRGEARYAGWDADYAAWTVSLANAKQTALDKRSGAAVETAEDGVTVG